MNTGKLKCFQNIEDKNNQLVFLHLDTINIVLITVYTYIQFRTMYVLK